MKCKQLGIGQPRTLVVGRGRKRHRQMITIGVKVFKHAKVSHVKDIRDADIVAVGLYTG
jgi:hypothetical protein